MGVKNLKKLPGVDQSSPKDQLPSLAGKKLAVDAAVWLAQLVKSSGHTCQVLLLGRELDFDKELEMWLLEGLGPFRRMSTQATFVTEGGESPPKSSTKQLREKEREERPKRLESCLASSSSSGTLGVGKHAKLVARATAGVWYSLKTFCTNFNFSTFSGALEAGPQLVSLCHQGVVDGVVTSGTGVVSLGFRTHNFLVVHDVDYQGFQKNPQEGRVEALCSTATSTLKSIL